ncbi:CDP-alcohol phosphatidyltransferase family protein [Jatrophihabitans fulvus]
MAFLAGLSANQVSLISAACTYTAIALVALVAPSWPMSIAVCALLVLGYALDSADGQVARLRGSGSPAGEWLDHVLDAIKLSTFHLAVAVCWFRHFDLERPSALLLPLAFSACATVYLFTIMLTDMLRRVERLRHGGTGDTTSRVDPNEAAPVLRSIIVIPVDYGVLCLVMALLPLHDVFVVVYGLLAVTFAAFLAAGCAQWFRELKRISR